MTDEEKRIKAAELMGWRRLHVATEGCLSGSLVGTPQRWLTDVDMGVPNYLNDIAAAWELVERLQRFQGDGGPRREVELSSDVGRWQCCIGIEGWPCEPHVVVLEMTAPRAITTAFILAMEGE